MDNGRIVHAGAMRSFAENELLRTSLLGFTL